MWDDVQGDNLLGSDSRLHLDIQTGDDGWGCGENGLLADGTEICSSSWVFFNLDGSSSEYGLQRRKPFYVSRLYIKSVCYDASTNVFSRILDPLP